MTCQPKFGRSSGGKEKGPDPSRDPGLSALAGRYSDGVFGRSDSRNVGCMYSRCGTFVPVMLSNGGLRFPPSGYFRSWNFLHSLSFQNLSSVHSAMPAVSGPGWSERPDSIRIRSMTKNDPYRVSTSEATMRPVHTG